MENGKDHHPPLIVSPFILDELGKGRVESLIVTILYLVKEVQTGLGASVDVEGDD